MSVAKNELSDDEEDRNGGGLGSDGGTRSIQGPGRNQRPGRNEGPGNSGEAGCDRVPVDIIDFKEPGRGALAPTSPELWRRVSAAHSRLSDSDSPMSDARSRDSRSITLASATHRPALTNRVTPRLSAALGDWRTAMEVADRVPDSFRFAKMGPEGLSDPAELVRRWDEVRERLADPVDFVPVAYADHDRAGCPAVESVIDLCLERGHDRLLIDSFDKSGPGTIDWLTGQSPSRLTSVVRRARQAGLWLSLAGKIDLPTANALADSPTLRPQCFGIRGAVCQQSRVDAICPAKLNHWRRWRHATADPAAQTAQVVQSFIGT